MKNSLALQMKNSLALQMNFFKIHLHSTEISNSWQMIFFLACFHEIF